MDNLPVTAEVTLVKRVIEVGENDINKYLCRGWVLLAVLKKVTNDSLRYEYPSFVVGHAEANAT